MQRNAIQSRKQYQNDLTKRERREREKRERSERENDADEWIDEQTAETERKSKNKSEKTEKKKRDLSNTVALFMSDDTKETGKEKRRRIDGLGAS